MTILTSEFTALSPVTADDNSCTAVSETKSARISQTQTDLPPDARLYLRHVEGGESIRAIAREQGCHASTILRRIRRFESRRDDPLIDNAIKQAAKSAAAQDKRRENRTRSVLRRLAEPGAELIVAHGMDKAMVSRSEIRTAILDRSLAEEFALRGWIELTRQGQRLRHYRLTSSGRAMLRSLNRGASALPRARDFAGAEPVPQAGSNAPQGMSEAAASFDHAEQHRVWGTRPIQDPEDGSRRTARVNLAENPLLLLARRRDPSGNPFLGPDLVAAGERIREDFELAQMGPRVTQNWDRFMTAGISESLHGSKFDSGSGPARARVAEALRELGPGMGDLVLRVCCFLEGLEMTERRLGWSARSGKVVLKLALERLARHYEARYGSGGPMIG